MSHTKIYKCGTESDMVVEVLSNNCNCTLSCCGEEMTLMEENSVDAAVEKHVPILSEHANGVKVVVGSVAHPMTDDHYIQWIEVVNGPWVNRKYLKPGEAPEAEFYVPNNGHLEVRAYCNLHGLWKG
ncbi:desulfoferrodoxin [Lentisphaerota bacterium WC36G]|nr:desulfoferrodoxin [Lentisphaerae bacterium WC36]